LGGRKSAKTIYEAWIAQLEQINSVSKQVSVPSNHALAIFLFE